jgi:hypothetical protein
MATCYLKMRGKEEGERGVARKREKTTADGLSYPSLPFFGASY